MALSKPIPNIQPGKHFMSRSVIVGNLIFSSAVSAQSVETSKVEAKTAEEQMVAALENVRMAMKEAGSSMNNIIQTTVILKNIEDYPTIRKVEVEYYKQKAPLLIEEPTVSAFYHVRHLSKLEYLVEVEVIGVVSRG